MDPPNSRLLRYAKGVDRLLDEAIKPIEKQTLALARFSKHLLLETTASAGAYYFKIR
jgi:hypothetical protein